MPLTVLSDQDVRGLLLSLTKEDVLELQHNLSEAMHDYSTGTQESSAGCSQNQPKRIVMPASQARKTVIMPAATATSRGITARTMAVPESLPSASGTPSRASSMSAAPSLSHTSSSSSSTGATSYSISHQPSVSTAPSSVSLQESSPRGHMTLMTESGLPYAFLAAEELTAFRTALASTIILVKRDRVHSIVIFGAGEQARWHIRLALLLRGQEIHHIDIINRSFARAKSIMCDFYHDKSWQSLRDANPKLQFSVLSSEYKEYDQHLKDHLRKADVIFCCTPALAPLFPHEILTSPEGRKKGRYIAAIGSFRPNMIELPPELLHQAVHGETHQHHHHHLPHLIHHKTGAKQGGVVIVDSLESALQEAGEVVQAKLPADKLVEAGELFMIRKRSMREIELGVGEGEKGLRDWIIRGNVIYKIVGIGCMDVCVAEDIVIRAIEREIGTTVEGF